MAQIQYWDTDKRGRLYKSQYDISFNYIWLLQQIKLVSSGVDAKANKHFNSLQALTDFCTIKQGDTKSNDSYRNLSIILLYYTIHCVCYGYRIWPCDFQQFQEFECKKMFYT